MSMCYFAAESIPANVCSIRRKSGTQALSTVIIDFFPYVASVCALAHWGRWCAREIDVLLTRL